jgi:hypothetical protein
MASALKEAALQPYREAASSIVQHLVQSFPSADEQRAVVDLARATLALQVAQSRRIRIEFGKEDRQEE